MSVTLWLATGDPLFPAGEARTYDSKIEERFARAFGRAARDWEIVREPEPAAAGNARPFPDFCCGTAAMEEGDGSSRSSASGPPNTSTAS